MRRLVYVLRFVRPAGTVPTGERTVASSVSITTAITPEGVTGKLKDLPELRTAIMQNKAVVNKDGKTFTESGTITFGDPAGGNKIHFSSIGVGYIDVYPCPEKPYTAGTVMWQVDKGGGFFKGATGAITSNFLIDLTKPEDEGELIDHHFGVIYLP